MSTLEKFVSSAVAPNAIAAAEIIKLNLYKQYKANIFSYWINEKETDNKENKFTNTAKRKIIKQATSKKAVAPDGNTIDSYNCGKAGFMEYTLVATKISEPMDKEGQYVVTKNNIVVAEATTRREAMDKLEQMYPIRCEPQN